MRPIFRKQVSHFLGDSEHHSSAGEWRVEHPRVRWDITDAFREAAAQYGIPKCTDFNTGDNEGCAYFHVNQKRGRRWSSARGFLAPVMGRANLRVETGCLAENIAFDGKRATGINFVQNGAQKFARCRGEVILSAGAIGSVQLMLLSGIGPSAQLKEHGIATLLEKPGVGENLQDHLQLRLIHKVSGVQTLNETYSSLWRRAADGARLRVAPPRPAHHGALAARRLHALGSGSGAAEHPVPCAAALARQIRRSAASVPGLHHQRRESAAAEPRPSSGCARPIPPTSR